MSQSIAKGKIIILGLAVALAAVALGVVLTVFAGNDTKEPEPKEMLSEEVALHGAPPKAKPSKATNAGELRARKAELATAVAAVRDAEADAKATKRKELERVMEDLKELLMKEPDTTLQMARDALINYPDSEKTPELNWYVIRSLLELNQRDDAIIEANRLVEQYPGNYFAEDVRRHLLTPMGPPR